MVPPIIDENFLNILSSRLDNAEKQYTCVTSLIYRLESEMRDVVGLAQKVAESQLDILRRHIQIPIAERKISFIAEEAVKAKNELLSEYITHFKGALESRNALPEGEEIIPLTSEKRETLCDEFYQRMTSLLDPHFDLSYIDEETDLILLQDRLQKTAMMETKTFQTLAEKKKESEQSHTHLESFIENLNKDKEKFKNELTTTIPDIFTACQLGNTNWIKEQVEALPWYKQKRFVTQIHRTPKTFFTSLHTAAYKNHASAISILTKYGAHVEAKDKYGYTPLHFAAQQGADSALEALLNSGAFIDAQGEYGRTPLIMAAFNGRVSTVARLLYRGANPNIHNHKSKDGNYQTPLHEAVSRNQPEVLRVLLQNPFLNVMEVDINGHTAFHHAFDMGLTDILEMLLAHPSWTQPQNIQDPNHLDNLLRNGPKYIDQEKDKATFLKLKKILDLKSREHHLRTVALKPIYDQITKLEAERNIELARNGVPKNRISLIIKYEANQKREELMKKMESDITHQLKQFEEGHKTSEESTS